MKGSDTFYAAGDVSSMSGELKELVTHELQGDFSGYQSYLIIKHDDVPAYNPVIKHSAVGRFFKKLLSNA